MPSHAVEPTPPRDRALDHDAVAETVVPSDFFDELLQDLDAPEPSPALRRAAERVHRGATIVGDLPR